MRKERKRNCAYSRFSRSSSKARVLDSQISILFNSKGYIPLHPESGKGQIAEYRQFAESRMATCLIRILFIRITVFTYETPKAREKPEQYCSMKNGNAKWQMLNSLEWKRNYREAYQPSDRVSALFSIVCPDISQYTVSAGSSFPRTICTKSTISQTRCIAVTPQKRKGEKR